MQDLEIVSYSSPREAEETFAVMHELRPHIGPDAYPGCLQRLAGEGVNIISAKRDGRVVGCASYRFQYRLAHGPLVYVDDLVVAASERSGGVGARLLEWVAEEGKRGGAEMLMLDSGVQRQAAHRFYFRHGLVVASFNFQKPLAP
ncbi:MAG: GNAT family N-acetyltransferase [Parvularcula sp.]|jgi:GNAT superfamily N-acetyltransferase|nr:GNAT family N-acetyltransferase [Parvularcula sp.]